MVNHQHQIAETGTARGTRVPEQQLFDEPDVLMPAQFRELFCRRRVTNEERLMLAVLELAIADLLQTGMGRHGKAQAEREAAREWIGNGRRHWYSFLSICEHFGFSATAIRRALGVGE